MCTRATLAAGRAQRMAERAFVRTEAAETAEYEAEEARKAAEEALADWQRGERKEVQQSKQRMLAERRARLEADLDREVAKVQAAAAVAGLAEAEAEAAARRQQAEVAAEAQQDAENSLAEAEQDHADALQRQARAARRQKELAVEEAFKAASIEDSIRMQGLRDRAAASKQAETRARAAVAEANLKVAAAAAEAQAQASLVHGLRISQGKAWGQTATDRECKARARAEAAEVLEVAESLSHRLECALAAVRDRDAALTRLQADLAERPEEKRASSARAPTAMVIKPHVPGAPWPLEQRAIARDIMNHTGLAPSRFNIAYSGFFTLFTGQVPTTPYMCDAMFGKQCFDINGTVDDMRSAIANAKSPWPWALATDDGSAKGMCAVHTKNEKLHVIIASSWDPNSNLPYIEGVALRDPPAESGKGLAECNIDALNEAGYKWATFAGSGGDHTDHASGKIGERVKVQEYAESHGCPAGRGSSNGCSRHGYALEVKAAFNALLGHQDAESAALALYNCSALDRQLVLLCWDECGLPERLLKVFHSASKPTMSKWQVFEGFIVDWFLPLFQPVRVMVGNTPKTVIPHVHLAEYMCKVLRGTATGKAEDAGGDRLCRWKAYLGIVGNPIKVAALTVAADLEHHYGQLHNWCKRSCRKYGFGAGFKAHEIALSVLESEGVLKRAKAEPKAFFKTTTSYFESTSLHATSLTPAARADFEQRMQLAVDAMYEMHRKWNWAWTEPRFLMGAATSEEHRHRFVRQLLPLVGHGAALAAHLASQKSPPPPPPGHAAEELHSRMAECQEGLKEEWQRWGHEEHLDEWLLLATEPRQLNMPLPLSEAPVLSRERTPGVFGVFIGQIFVRLSDNTCCESGVSEYRPRAHQNQHEMRVEQRWKHSFRQRPLKDMLRDPALRSTTGGARKPAALAAAARQKSLQHHARSKQQCAELWRDSLRRAMGYSWKEARLLKVAQARFKAREARDGAHEALAKAKFKSLTETHERGPGGHARRAACDVATAVRADAPLAEQGKRGGGKIYNLAAIKARFRDTRADTKAATTAAQKARAAEKAAQLEASKAKAARVAAAAQRRKEEEAERAAEEHGRAIQETSERAARLWAHGMEREEQREQREQRQVAAARSRSYAGDDESDDEEDGSEAESDAEAELSDSGSEDEDETIEGEDGEEEGWYGESINEAAAVAAEQQRERQQEEAAARMAEADREAEEREARTLTARDEMALRKLIKAKTNQLEAQFTNGVLDDSPLACGLRGEITDARERLQRAGVVLT